MADFLEMIDQMNERLWRAETVPQTAIQEAEKQLIVLLPEYTGTYRDSVEAVPVGDEGGWSLRVTEEKLIEEAGKNDIAFDDEGGTVETSAADYVYDVAHPRFGKPDTPSGPYPLRIEAHGRLLDKQPSGEGAWADIAAKTGVFINQSLERIAKGGTK